MVEAAVPGLNRERVSDEPRPADARDETPMFFEAGGASLFGILTTPTTDPIGVGVILLSGGGAALSTNRNRLWVRLARQLATRGYHALRLDYHGVGESEGALEGFRLDRPFTEDVLGAVRWMERIGVHRHILIGTCFGARTALASARKVTGLIGVAVIAAPIRDFEMGERVNTGLALRLTTLDYVRRALQPRVLRRVLKRSTRRRYASMVKAKLAAMASRGSWRRTSWTRSDSWVSASFVSDCSAAFAQDAHLLFIYGEADDLWEEFEAASDGRLGTMLRKYQENVKVHVVDGPLHGFPRVSTQRSTLAIVHDWIRDVSATSTATVRRHSNSARSAADTKGPVGSAHRDHQVSG